MGENVQTAPAPAKSRWYYNVWFVLFMLFFVLGPLGLPLVWKNPRLSRLIKILLTVAVVAFTWWVVTVSIEIARQVVNRVNALNSTFPY